MELLSTALIVGAVGASGLLKSKEEKILSSIEERISASSRPSGRILLDRNAVDAVDAKMELKSK